MKTELKPSHEDQLATYDDIRLVADRAVDSAKGIAFTLPSHNEAIRWRQRFYKFRTLSRALSKKMYESDNPMYGRSPYEGLVIKNWERIEGVDPVRVEIIKAIAHVPEVEDL